MTTLAKPANNLGLPEWSEISAEFAWDGNFPGLFIRDTNLADWEALWAALLSWATPPVFSTNGIEEPLPALVGDVLEQAVFASVLLCLKVGKLDIHCHFTCVENFEFDIDPRQLASTDDARALENFMIKLGALAAKPVFLTEDGITDRIIAQCTANGGLVSWLEKRPK